jgi:eukaryotic-like serine/threonine-protein kinase
MDNVDTTALGDLAVRVGLLSPSQVQEGWDDVGKRGGDPVPWLRSLERKGYITPFQSAKLLKGEKDGFFLGGYRLLYKIASGSFGRVYRADDPKTGRVVAIKVLRRKWSDKKDTIELFEREGRVGMTLRHPNIVEILAVNRDNATHQYYIVMEFVEGGTLRDFLAIRKKLNVEETLRILEDVASGLHHALSKGLTHRDMKLTNVLISSQGVSKLVDFGLAEVSVKGAKEADDPNVDRTVDYAGLEKTTNVPHGDTRSDLFFLGCVAYQLLSGRSPLEMSKNPHDRMRRERFTNIAPLQAEEIDGSPSIIRLVENMMSLNPHERFQTPSQLLDAIRAVRREVEGKSAADQKAGPGTLFLAEKDERLQDVLRNKLKEMGFRVLIAADPFRAVDRFRQQPFDFFIVDAGTTGQEGLHVFERILDDAKRQHFALRGIIMFSEEQAAWASKMEDRANVGVLVQPIKLKQLLRKIQELQAL